MTEASPGVYLAVADGAPERPVSIGVPALLHRRRAGELPGTRPGHGRGQPETAEPHGELLVRGPNVFRGYWNRPAETARRRWPAAGSSSGDVVRIDDDGWAYVVDRIKDMIISGGENIYPAEVEAAHQRACPASSTARWSAVPDERWGEVGLAFVVSLRPGGLDRTVAARGAGRHRSPRSRSRSTSASSADLPRTATGKVRKQQLRAAAVPTTRRRSQHEHTRRHPGRPRAAGRSATSAPAPGSRSTRTASTPSPTPPTTTSGSTSIRSGPRTARSARTIAHGYLTLALLIPMWTELLDVREARTKVNYGLDKVRFPAPVPVGSKCAPQPGWPRSTRSTAAPRSPSTPSSSAKAATSPSASPSRSSASTAEPILRPLRLRLRSPVLRSNCDPSPRTPVPGRPCRQPAPPAERARCPRRPRRRHHERRPAARRRGRRHPRRRAHAGGHRPADAPPTASSGARPGTWTSSTSCTASAAPTSRSRCTSATRRATSTSPRPRSRSTARSGWTGRSSAPTSSS